MFHVKPMALTLNKPSQNQDVMLWDMGQIGITEFENFMIEHEIRRDAIYDNQTLKGLYQGSVNGWPFWISFPTDMANSHRGELDNFLNVLSLFVSETMGMRGTA